MRRSSDASHTDHHHGRRNPGRAGPSCAHRDELGEDDLAELRRDAVAAAVHDQLRAGLDVVTDEQGALRLQPLVLRVPRGDRAGARSAPALRPAAHDQRPRHRIVGELRAPAGLGVVDEFLAREWLPTGRLKASVPGAYTLAGRLVPSDAYPDRHAVTEALVPVVRAEIEQLVAEDAGW